MSMNDLLVECQNKVAQLEVERDKLAAQVNVLRTAALNAISYMSGGREKADLRDAYDATPQQCLTDIRAKAVMDFSNEAGLSWPTSLAKAINADAMNYVNTHFNEGKL